MNPRIAILDLGTNTFHLLVAELKPDHSFEILFRQEEFVKLGEEGVERIGERAFKRGIDQIRKYKEVIDELKPQKVVGFGTAAIRNASNGDELVRAIKETCPMELRKISGDEEAELIYLGVRQAMPLEEHPILIMDIGGGSTEFIVANQERIFWKKSMPLGGSLLKQRFHQKEPICAAEQVDFLNFLQTDLKEFFNELKRFPVRHLIGASGSFDSLASLYCENMLRRPIHPYELFNDIPLRDFYIISERLIRSTLEERLKMKGMIWFRAEMIVAATILAGFVIETCNIHRITRSAFALKEGALWQMGQKVNE